LVRSDCASILATLLRRISTILSKPPVAANINGVNPFLSLCSIFAPRTSKSLTNSSCPPAQATVRAVSWLLSVCESTLMPYDMSASLPYDSPVVVENSENTKLYN